MRGLRVWLIALAACDNVLQLQTVPQVPDAAADSALDAPGCSMASFFNDPFTSSTDPCGPWAMPFGQTVDDMVIEGAGTLKIVRKNAGITGCTAKNAMAFDENGFFVRIDQPSSASNAYMDMLLHDSSAGWKMQIGLINNLISFLASDQAQPYATKVYDQATMRFWRLRASVGTSEFVAEVSPDAAVWTELGRTKDHFTQMVFLELGAGMQALSPVQVTSQFSHLNTCP